MTEPRTARRPPAESAKWPRPRQEYERPRILFREPLEAIAAVCDPVTGKQLGDAFPCTVNPGS